MCECGCKEKHANVEKAFEATEKVWVEYSRRLEQLRGEKAAFGDEANRLREEADAQIAQIVQIVEESLVKILASKARAFHVAFQRLDLLEAEHESIASTIEEARKSEYPNPLVDARRNIELAAKKVSEIHSGLPVLNDFNVDFQAIFHPVMEMVRSIGNEDSNHGSSNISGSRGNSSGGSGKSSGSRDEPFPSR